MYMSLLILKQKHYIINLNKSTINCTLRKYISPLMFMPFYMYMYIISPVLLLLGRHAYNLFVWTLAHTLFKNPIGYLLLQLYLAIVYSNFDTARCLPLFKEIPPPRHHLGVPRHPQQSQDDEDDQNNGLLEPETRCKERIWRIIQS